MSPRRQYIRPRDALRIAGTVLWIGLAAGCGRQAPNLLLVVVDTLRSDHLGAYGAAWHTPSADSLAQQGTMWRRAYTPCPRTTQAVASIMTGLYPPSHGIRRLWGRLRDDRVTLAEILQSRGYTTAAVVSNHILHGETGIDRGFTTYDLVGDRPAGPTTDAAAEVLGSLPRRHPFFVWVHYQDPHIPYSPPDRFKGEISAPGSVPPELAHGFGRQSTGYDLTVPFGLTLGQLRFANPLPPSINGVIRDLYRGEVAYADHEIGRLLATLRRLGYGRNTVVVFTADHGEALGEHQYWCDHGDLLHEPGTRVPLIMTGPGIRRGSVAEATVSLLDVLPTTLNLLGLSDLTPDPVEGRNLLSPPVAATPLFLETGVCFEPGYWQLRKGLGDSEKFRAVIEESWKLTWYPDSAGIGRWTLHNLSSDPAETLDCVADYPDTTARLKGDLERWLSGDPAGRLGNGGDQAALNESTAHRLKSMGYME